jgi:predicted GNAT superfamily acetyltransferase
MEIRDVRGIDELRAVEDMQIEVWGVSEREIVSSLTMIPVVAVGGILLGAFDQGTLAGFVFGFPGFEGDERVIHSDMLAVSKAYRDQGLGRALKLAQRDRALAMGIDKITWTFDPMQGKNAHLNFGLGVIANRYLRDFYYQTTSPLHAGGTDRLWVTWHLHGVAPPAPAALRIPITTREAMRAAFESAFARGMVAFGFDRATNEYLLTQTESRHPAVHR